MKSYKINVTRVLQVRDTEEDVIIIKDLQNSAEAVFTKVRWSIFLCWINSIDAEVKKLKENKSEFRFCQHYGGGWKASVTSGIWCIDLRHFYVNKDGEEKPSRHGIGLRVHEWEKLKCIIEQIRADYPELYAVNGCDHNDLVDWLNCAECIPFVRRSQLSATEQFDSCARGCSSPDLFEQNYKRVKIEK